MNKTFIQDFYKISLIKILTTRENYNMRIELSNCLTMAENK